jgi:hypothetical protein
LHDTDRPAFYLPLSATQLYFHYATLSASITLAPADAIFEAAAYFAAEGCFISKIIAAELAIFSQPIDFAALRFRRH